MKPYENKELLYHHLITQNKSYQQTARDIGCSFTAVRNWAIKFGFTKSLKYEIFNKEFGLEVCEKYKKQGVLIKDLALEYNVDKWYIEKALEVNNVNLKTRREIKSELDKRNVTRTHSLKYDYFKTWSSNMAYILGFISADGCIAKNKNTLVISLQTKDREILEKIKQELEYEGQLRIETPKVKGKTYEAIKLSITSKGLVDDLKTLGLTERKSFTVSFPNEMPEEYELDFIRGYFDGDGSVGGQYPSNSNGIKTKKLQIRVRICSGGSKILEQIRDVFSKHGLKHKKVKSYKNRENYFEICYSTYESIKIYELLYSDSLMFLKRKKDRFLELINERQQN